MQQVLWVAQAAATKSWPEKEEKTPKISFYCEKIQITLEALDSLVISTIYNVSTKLCGASANVLRRAVNVFPEQDEEQVCVNPL